MLTAPGWLWPEPRNPNGGALAPQSRPRVVRDARRSLLRGEWLTLLDHMPIANPRPAARPHEPGLVTPNTANKWLQKASQGKVCAVWKMLMSRGIASQGPRVIEKIMSKWQVQSQGPLPMRRTPQAAAVEKLLQGQTLHKAVRRFRQSRARDSSGWTSKTFSAILQHQNGKAAIIGMLRKTWLHETFPMICQLIGMTHSVALVKDSSGAARPIAIPSMFRKLQAGLLVVKHGEAIQRHLGEDQYGAGMANGVTKFGLWVQKEMHLHADHICLQTDISNAFGGLLRQQVLAAFEEILYDFADLVGAWLAQCPFRNRSWYCRSSFYTSRCAPRRPLLHICLLCRHEAGPAPIRSHSSTICPMGRLYR